MEQVTKQTAIRREAFDRAVREWFDRSQDGDTVGDTSGRGQKAWVFVRDGGDLYYLNADSKYEGAREYLRMLAEAPKLAWHIVANQKGRMNKVAFGVERRIVPGFYFYCED